tara:strand:+ start:704 stop:883 length:180 start_codon:yes stop_codon:yes gene_type:complete
VTQRRASGLRFCFGCTAAKISALLCYLCGGENAVVKFQVLTEIIPGISALLNRSSSIAF